MQRFQQNRWVRITYCRVINFSTTILFWVFVGDLKWMQILIMKQINNLVQGFNRRVSRRFYRWVLRPQSRVNSQLISKLNYAAVMFLFGDLEMRFLEFLFKNNLQTYSQFKQDLFICFLSKDWSKKYFLEIGAGDGVNLSNTYLLERQENWTGVLVEPNREFRLSIMKNRSAQLVDSAITVEESPQVMLIPGKRGEFSRTINSEIAADENGYLVNAISAQRLFSSYGDSDLSFLSLDIEGLEDAILEALFLTRCRPFAITVEHNFSSSKMSKIKKLARENSYKIVCQSMSEIDYWLVRNDILSKFMHTSK
jgi:hypothetical protein